MTRYLPARTIGLLLTRQQADLDSRLQQMQQLQRLHEQARAGVAASARHLAGLREAAQQQPFAASQVEASQLALFASRFDRFRVHLGLRIERLQHQLIDLKKAERRAQTARRDALRKCMQSKQRLAALQALERQRQQWIAARSERRVLELNAITSTSIFSCTRSSAHEP